VTTTAAASEAPPHNKEPQPNIGNPRLAAAQETACGQQADAQGRQPGEKPVQQHHQRARFIDRPQIGDPQRGYRHEQQLNGQDEAFKQQDNAVRKYLKPDLVIIDDMGLKALPSNSGEYLLEVIMRRYENRSTIMTSNRPLEDWGKLLSDVPTAGAILDRFLHHAILIAISGRSYRGPRWRRCRPCHQRQAPDALRSPGSRQPRKVGSGEGEMSFSHLPWLALASLQGIRPAQSALWTERECTWQSYGPIRRSGCAPAEPYPPEGIESRTQPGPDVCARRCESGLI